MQTIRVMDWQTERDGQVIEQICSCMLETIPKSLTNKRCTVQKLFSVTLMLLYTLKFWMKNLKHVFMCSSVSVTFCCSIVWNDWWDSSWLQSLPWPNVAEIFIVKVFQTNHNILCRLPVMVSHTINVPRLGQPLLPKTFILCKAALQNNFSVIFLLIYCSTVFMHLSLL